MLTVISRSFRIQVLLLAVLAVALLSAAAQGATANVSITNDRFTDSVSGNSTTTINAGDSVMWTWNAGNHSTTSGSCAAGCTPNGTWDSGIKNSGSTFTQAFPTAGTFTYYCRVHGSMMQGTIVVQAGAGRPHGELHVPAGGADDRHQRDLHGHVQRLADLVGLELRRPGLGNVEHLERAEPDPRVPVGRAPTTCR